MGSAMSIKRQQVFRIMLLSLALLIGALITVSIAYPARENFDAAEPETGNGDRPDEKSPTDTQYKLSVLSIFKNETLNLKMWIEHYLWQGANHFYLIDNGSTDNPETILAPYIKRGLISLKKLPEKYKQIEHYKTIWREENIRDDTKWLVVADLDEFWFSPNSTLAKEIDGFDEYDVVYSNWKMFGTDGLDKHPDDIRVAILNRQPELNENKKWICKTENVKETDINIHAIDNPRLKDITDTATFHLNHYPIQSKEFYKKVKMTRGDASDPNTENIRDWKYFNKYNENMTYNDTVLRNMVLDITPT
jgi:hypothetical protein